MRDNRDPLCLGEAMLYAQKQSPVPITLAEAYDRYIELMAIPEHGSADVDNFRARLVGQSGVVRAPIVESPVQNGNGDRPTGEGTL